MTRLELEARLLTRFDCTCTSTVSITKVPDKINGQCFNIQPRCCLQLQMVSHLGKLALLIYVEDGQCFKQFTDINDTWKVSEEQVYLNLHQRALIS